MRLDDLDVDVDGELVLERLLHATLQVLDLANLVNREIGIDLDLERGDVEAAFARELDLYQSAISGNAAQTFSIWLGNT